VVQAGDGLRHAHEAADVRRLEAPGIFDELGGAVDELGLRGLARGRQAFVIQGLGGEITLSMGWESLLLPASCMPGRL
jgi:hypothetical protein